MLLKYSIKKIKYDNKEVVINTIEKEDNKIKFTTNKSHFLIKDDLVTLLYMWRTLSFKEVHNVLSDELSDNVFKITYNPYKKIYIEYVENNIVTIKGDYAFKLDSTNNNINEYEVYIEKERKIVNEETNETSIEKYNVYYLIKSKGSNFFEVIKSYKKNSEDKEIEIDINFNDFNNIFTLFQNIDINYIKIYETTQYVNFSLPLSNSSATELNDEDICKVYFNERKKELIPEIVDFEKQCFSPSIKTNTGNIRASKINFNIFLRERRSITDWNSDDMLGWNQYKLDLNTGVYSLKSSETQRTKNGDLLGYLGFTDEDIYYRKKKLEKTFLRLSFYSSRNPSNQMLLFYSTIFLDTGELYNKYINNVKWKLEHPDRPIVYEIFDNEKNNLTCSFSVTDRFDKNKSSEGFYLYLFPDGIEDNKERTIYMKVELNHAGYGKTIPLIMPYDEEYNLLGFMDNTDKETSTKNNPMPTCLIQNGDLKDYFKYLYIPITIKYDNILNEYTYSFNHYENNSSIIDINLYESKIN